MSPAAIRLEPFVFFFRVNQGQHLNILHVYKIHHIRVEPFVFFFHVEQGEYLEMF